ncbi:MAG: hypothetical protein V4858_01130 [Pseudomonadota bacterium]
MLHPLYRLILAQPGLLGNHAMAYAELLAADLGTLSQHWKRRLILNLLVVCSLGVAAVLAGVALMLWAVVPAIQSPWAWVLLLVPLLPLVLAAVCAMAATNADDGNHRALVELRKQVHADVAMLREMEPP